MNILFLNWRDPLHPQAGGAEKLNQHISEALVKAGHEVTWYAMSFRGSSHSQTLAGINIVRFGSVFVHYLCWPFLFWFGRLGKPDLVIDCIHGLGYFTPLVIPKIKKKILICEVAQDIWDEMVVFPLNKLGRVIEKVMLQIYRKQDFITISQSTSNDLVRFGIPETSIAIVPMGYDAVRVSPLPQKAILPTAIFVGRLCEMKGIKAALQAIKLLSSTAQPWHLVVVGRGEVDYERELKNLSRELDITSLVTFLGFIPEKEKFIQMAKAWVLVTPSIREGWGMTVPEANSVGTQAVGYNVPGLRDVLPHYSSRNALVNPTPQSLADALTAISSPVKVKPEKPSGWTELSEFTQKHLG